MYSFKNDYSECFHPEICRLLSDACIETNEPYGEDVHSLKAAEIIRGMCGNEKAEVVFTQGGTQTNVLAISAFLRNSYEAVICASTGHVNVHETGAIEYAGHKVLTVPSKCDGKLTPEMIDSVLSAHESEHMVEPRLCYISQSTELGGVYNRKELAELSSYCHKNGLYLYMDGARFGSAMASEACDLSVSDIAGYVDAFYFGGTKNGMPFGEALVFLDTSAADHIRWILKNHGFMTAKGFVIGMMFEKSLEGGLYFEMAKHANLKAYAIRDVLEKLGYEFYASPVSNQLFVLMTKSQAEGINAEFGCNIENLGNGMWTARIVTSWSTTDEAVESICSWLTEKAADQNI